MAIDKTRPRKLNATADSRLRKADEMQDALNLVSSNDFRATGDTTEGNDGTGNSGVLKPTRGTFEVPPFNSLSTMIPKLNIQGQEIHKRALGSVTDHANNVVYFFVWCSEAIYQGVYAYDPTGYLPVKVDGAIQVVAGVETYKKVFTSSLFNFPSDGFIKADLVHINTPLTVTAEDTSEIKYETQPILYFTDNTNEPRKVHAFRALTEDFSDYALVDINDFITVCPKTPVFPITAIFERDDSDSTSSFEGLPGFQFAYQHIYKGGEESSLSTFSDIAVPQAYYKQGSSSSADLYANNKCVLTIPSLITYNVQSDDITPQKIRTKEIAEVRILRRVGNSGTWATIEELPVSELEANDNKYNFYNRSIAAGFPQQMAIKPFDNVPQKAESQAVVSDRLMYGNYVEGYNNVKITAKASVEYHNRPQDFKELEIYLTPTLRFVGPEAELAAAPAGAGGNVGGQINKRAGYYIDTKDFPPSVEKGTILQMDFSIRPNRNFHIYNSDNSFHGSRHLSIQTVPQDDGSDEVLDGVLRYPEVYGLEATEEETRGSTSTNTDLNHMFGKNKGVGDGLGLKWTTVASQQGDLNMAPVEAVFGTSAANPFILRGNSLHFSVKIQAIAQFDNAPVVLKRIMTTLLANYLSPEELGQGLTYDDFLTAPPEDDFTNTADEGDQSRVKVLEVKSRSSYQIDEGLSGHNAGTSSIDAVNSTSQIPVSFGGDDRKHLIVAVGDGGRIHSGATTDDLRHLTPCGYFIVNRADVTFGFMSEDNTTSDGFLQLDVKSLDNIDILSAIPFINAEKWKDEWFEAAYDNNNARVDPYASSGGNLRNNNPRNWGLRDATIWSLDSLIVDSWYCYSKDYMQGANFNPKIFTSTATDFPRYMNNSDVVADGAGHLAGDLNENVTNNGRGKNAAILNIGDDPNHFMHPQDSVGNSRLNVNYAVRWNPLVLFAFRQTHVMPYLQALELADTYCFENGGGNIRTKWKHGRHRLMGFLTGIENDQILPTDDPNFNYSLVDGAIGPGSAADGSENIRKVSGGDTDYAVGSVTGEMIMAGRIAPRGYFRPEMPKTGKRQSSDLAKLTGYDNWFHQYGQGGVLPYLGGIGYQQYKKPNSGPSATGVISSQTEPFGDRSIGFIHNWFYDGDTGAFDDDGGIGLEGSPSIQPFVASLISGNTLFSQQYSRYLGDPRWNENGDNTEDEWQIIDAEDDLKASARIRDAEIGLTGREFGIFGGGDWNAGGRSFKTRANHAFGIVYYDERGRSGKVNPITFSTVNQAGDGTLDDFIEPTASLGVYIKGYSPSERSAEKNGRASITIDLEGVTPPSWAHHFQIMYGGNTTKGSFIQYSTGGAFVASKNTSEEGGEEGEDPNSTSVYVSLNYLQGNKDVSYAEAFGAVSTAGTKNLYIHKPGDKLRVLSYYRRPDAPRVWVENTEFDIMGVETVSNNPNSNIFRRAFERSEDSNIVADCRSGQFLVLKNNVRAEGFNYSSVKAGGNADQTTAHLWNNLCVVEIYSPAKQTDVEDRLFYEMGEVYSIRRDPLTQELLHHNSITDNESVILNKGDVWFKPVAMAAAEYGQKAFNEDGDALTSYLKFKNLIRKGVNDGESSPRFKNYYVESMTFNDSFAGNNVTSKGKPNTVDKDVSQTRKGSSVIFSDKQDFSKRKVSFPSFNGTAKNWKDLPGEFGNINYLQNNYDSLICLQENKSSTIPVERNILTDAAGSNTLMTSSKVVGVQAFFAGEYGCDNNPEAVVKNDAATYFASKAKSEVYRLTAQGVQVISKEGMSSYFFRLFEEVKKAKEDGEGKVYIPGGYDPLKDEFLITISNLKYKHSNGVQALLQGNWGDTTPLIYGCMDPGSVSFDPLANVDQVSAEDASSACLYAPLVTGCMDPCATTYDHNAVIPIESDCAFFDLCSFDYFSESADGVVTAEDIAYCYENVMYADGTMGATPPWEGLTPLQITQLGWEYGWIKRQVTVQKNELNNVVGGTFCTEGGQYHDIPMQYTTFDFNNNATTNDIPNGGWDFNNGIDLINFSLGLLQQMQGDEQTPVTCNIYGCTDPNSDDHNEFATHSCDEAPPVWFAIRQYHLDNPTQDEDDIPWEICNCADGSTGLG